MYKGSPTQAENLQVIVTLVPQAFPCLCVCMHTRMLGGGMCYTKATQILSQEMHPQVFWAVIISHFRSGETEAQGGTRSCYGWQRWEKNSMAQRQLWGQLSCHASPRTSCGAPSRWSLGWALCPTQAHTWVGGAQHNEWQDTGGLLWRPEPLALCSVSHQSWPSGTLLGQNLTP